MFKPAKKVSGGYNIQLTEPLKFTLPLFCPFGIDIESGWKWSVKFYVQIRPDSTKKHDILCYNFLSQMLELESHIQTYLKQQFPNTFKEYFVVQTFLGSARKQDVIDGFINDEIEDTGCFFRAKVPVKNNIAETSYTGSGKWETKRTLVPDDIPEKTRVLVDIECDSWWITETKNGKSVGYTITLKHVRELQS